MIDGRRPRLADRLERFGYRLEVGLDAFANAMADVLTRDVRILLQPLGCLALLFVVVILFFLL